MSERAKSGPDATSVTVKLRFWAMGGLKPVADLVGSGPTEMEAMKAAMSGLAGITLNRDDFFSVQDVQRPTDDVTQPAAVVVPLRPRKRPLP